MLHLYILVNNIVFVSISVNIGIDRHTGTLLIMKVIYKYNIKDLVLQWDKSPA